MRRLMSSRALPSSRAQRGICTLLLVAAPLAAQDFPDESHRHTGANAVIREVAAGAVGSFAGFVPVMLIPSCFEHTHYNANVECRGPLVLGVFVASPIGTTSGTYLAARHDGSRRSIVGAWLGGVAGGVAGVALANAMDRGGAGPGLTFPTYYLVQSTMSVIGSRVAAGLRRQ
jgi:hypothetical protein